MSTDHEFQIALHAPICPQLLREDAVVVDADGWHRTLTPSSPWAADNEVLLSSLPADADAADAEIDAIVAGYHALGRPMRWCVYPWSSPTDLGARLVQRGARQWDVRAFVCDTTLPLEPVEGVEIERVPHGASEAFDAYMALMTSGWDLPADEVAFRRRRYPELITSASIHLFVARHQGVVAGCGAFVVKDDSAYMTGDYVVPAFQARGLFQTLLAVRLRALREMGIGLASGHAREKTSAPWLQRFGFRTKFTYRIYQLEPPAAAE
jgi:GNAT superfamily N-acetyltransferase